MEQLQNAWNWYIGLFSDPSVGTRIAAWAATLATLTFLLNFILKPLARAIKSRTQKLKVELGMTHGVLVIPGFSDASQMLQPDMTCTITNQSNEVIHILRPRLETSREVNSTRTFMIPVPSRFQYPFKLGHGEQQKFSFPAAALVDHVLSRMRERDTIRFLVETTTDKQYRSNSLNKKFIVGHMDVPRRFNER